MQGDYNGYSYHTFSGKIYFSLIIVLKSRKKEAGTNFVLLSQSKKTI